VNTVVRVRPVMTKRVTKWAVSCSCKFGLPEMLTKQAAELLAQAHVRDRHEGKGVLAVQKPRLK
jgi:hypothetical protein